MYRYYQERLYGGGKVAQGKEMCFARSGMVAVFPEDKSDANLRTVTQIIFLQRLRLTFCFAEVDGLERAPLKSIGSGDVSMAIDPLPPIGGTR